MNQLALRNRSQLRSKKCVVRAQTRERKQKGDDPKVARQVPGAPAGTPLANDGPTTRRLLAVRRHLYLFEDHVLANDRIVLLDLQLTLLGTLVLGRVVREAGTGRRDEADVVTHGARA